MLKVYVKLFIIVIFFYTSPYFHFNFNSLDFRLKIVAKENNSKACYKHFYILEVFVV